MAARTISELANWDGRRDTQRHNSKWRRRSPSSMTMTRDPPRPSQPLSISQHATKFSGQKRAGKSSLERDPLSSTPANTRLSSRVDTTSSSAHHPSHLHSTPNSALHPSSFNASPSSRPTPNSAIHASRVHDSRPTPSRAHIAQLQPASTMRSEVIDLTVEDTEDEFSVCDILVPKNNRFNRRYTDPAPSTISLSSSASPPISFDRSLFTPPPLPRKRPRLFLDHIAVPSFPRGWTKADYHPIPAVPSPPTPLGVLPPPLVVTEPPVPSTSKGKGRERDPASPRNRYKSPLPATDAAFLGACTVIPIQDDDTYPPLTALDLATNTRFRFAQAWRQHASTLQHAELDWMVKFKLLGKACVWAQSVNTPSPRMPGTAGYVSSEQLRPWELVSSESPSQEDEQSQSRLAGEAHVLPPPNVPTGSTPAPPTSTIFQGPSTVVDMEHDMNQYFNGLSDSPHKRVLARQQLASAHAYRSHLLQSGSESNTLGLGFPSLDLDLRLARTGDHECFLGVPPSPQPADIESTASGPILNYPLKPEYPPALSSPIFEAAPTDAWAFEGGESLLLNNDSPPSNNVAPAVLGTIDPSLLDPGQSRTPSQSPKPVTQRKHSKLPEPVIYVRRPTSSSKLPVISGKRTVQIKYRDSAGSSATPVAQTRTDGAPSDVVDSPVALSSNGTESPRKKRLTSSKQREHIVSDSDSDYMPTSTNIELKRKRASLREVKSDVEDAHVEAKSAPTMSFCHQCRNTTLRPKMTCSNAVQGRVCGKRFCNRCILYRYPDITFDERSAGFLCPVCTNTCNCSACSRNRGEEFVSMRLGGLAASLFKAKVTLVRDANSQQEAIPSTTTTPEPGALPVPEQRKFWAHVYGMEGERVGRAFMTREHMAQLQAGAGGGLPQPPAPPSVSALLVHTKKARKRRADKAGEKRGPRVFIGRPLASWHVRGVRDLEPSVDVGDVKGKGKGKENVSGTGRRRRCYIGNPRVLYEPYGRMLGPTTPHRSASSTRCSTPVSDSDESLTSLSELEEEMQGGDRYWPQPAVGEYCSWVPPMPPLGSVSEVVEGGTADVGKDQVVSPASVSGSGSGSGLDAAADVGVGNQPSLVSKVLPEADMARAIGAAFAALFVDPPRQ